MAQAVSYGSITIVDTTDIARIKNWYLASASSSGIDISTSGWTDDPTSANATMTATKQYLWNYEEIQGTGPNNTYITTNRTDPVIIGRYGQNGNNGKGITRIDEYYKANNVPNAHPTTWNAVNVIDTPTSTNRYLWNYQVIVYDDNTTEGSAEEARVIGVYGDPGAPGVNTATVYLYQRTGSTPAKPSGNLTYTFSSAQITSGTLGNWKQSIGELTSTNPIWVIAAVASSNGDTDTIASNEWSTPIKLAENGTAGLNQATIYIYKRANSVTTPSSTTYTFSNGSFTVPSGWSKYIPTSDGKPCYVTSAVAIGSGTTATLTWNTPSILVEDGTNGISPTVTSTSNGVKIVDADGNETYITNGTNGTSYYTYVRYSENSNGSNYVSVPTPSTIYIGVYSGTSDTPPGYKDSGWKWSRYVGNNGVSVTGTRELYYLKTNSTDVPQITNSNQITATDRQNGWTSIVPTYMANTEYWTCIETSLSVGGPVWSLPILNQGLTDSNYNAYVANSIATHAQEDAEGALSQSATLDVKLKNFFWPGDSNYPGAYAVGKGTNDGLDAENISTYGYNLRLTPITLSIGYNQFKAIEIDGSNPALKFYKPSKTTQGAQTAQLDANGLVLSEGGIEAGNAGQSGFIYLSTENYGSNLTINGHQASNWKEIIGTKFGVDADGNLYASNTTISGAITATSLSTGTKTSETTGKGIFINSSGAIYSGDGNVNNFIINEYGAITAKSGTIGGFIIDATSIHSVGKTLNNNVSGLYMDSQGQFNTGDTTNFIASWYDTNENKWKVRIQSDLITFSNGQSVSGVVQEIGENINDVDKALKSSLSGLADVTVSTTGISENSIEIKESDFANKIGDDGTYTFSYTDGTGWTLNDEVVDISDYGIIIADGVTPTNGDSITITATDVVVGISYITANVQNTAEDAATYAESLKAIVDQHTEEISGLQGIDELYGERIETNEEIIAKTTTDVGALTEATTSLQVELQNELSERAAFVEFGTTDQGQPILILRGGETASLQAALTSSMLEFIDDGTPVAYISGQKLFISTAQITDQLRFGDFAFIPRGNGNLSLKYVGDE